MKVFAVAVALSVFAPQIFGQSGNDVALEKFLPSTNAYARRMVTDQFSLMDDLKKIDPEVLAIFHSKVRSADIANRGQAFNPTDVIVDNAPMRRFVMAGSAPGFWFILYEHGGIAYHHNLMVFSRSGHWQIAAALSGSVKGDNLESLRQAIEAGRFFSQPGHPQF